MLNFVKQLFFTGRNKNEYSHKKQKIKKLFLIIFYHVHRKKDSLHCVLCVLSVTGAEFCFRSCSLEILIHRHSLSFLYVTHQGRVDDGRAFYAPSVYPVARALHSLDLPFFHALVLSVNLGHVAVYGFLQLVRSFLFAEFFCSLFIFLTGCCRSVQSVLKPVVCLGAYKFC